jgi:uncharacterized OB-fold protein
MDPRNAFPKPCPDADTEAFWQGCERGELLVPRCGACGRWVWQPRPVCPDCRCESLDWHEVSGTATVASWIVLRPPVLPAYAEMVPFVVVLAELKEGVRMVGYLVDADGHVLRTDGCAEAIGMGAALALRFHMQDGVRLPCWTLA